MEPAVTVEVEVQSGSPTITQLTPYCGTDTPAAELPAPSKVINSDSHIESPEQSRNDDESKQQEIDLHVRRVSLTAGRKISNMSVAIAELEQSNWTYQCCGMVLSEENLRQKGPFRFSLWSHILLYALNVGYWALITLFVWSDMKWKRRQNRLDHGRLQFWVGTRGYLLSVVSFLTCSLLFHTVALFAPYYIYEIDTRLTERIHAVYEAVPMALLRWVGIHVFGSLVLFSLSYGSAFNALIRYLIIMLGTVPNIALHSTLHVPYYHAGVYVPTLNARSRLDELSMNRWRTAELIEKRALAPLEAEAINSGDPDEYRLWKELQMNLSNKLGFLLINTLKYTEVISDLTYGSQLILAHSYSFGIPILICGVFDFILEDTFLVRPDLKRRQIWLVLLDLVFEIPEVALGVASLRQARKVGDSQFYVAILMIVTTLGGLLWSLNNVYVWYTFNRGAFALLAGSLQWLCCGGRHPLRLKTVERVSVKINPDSINESRTSRSRNMLRPSTPSMKELENVD